MTTFEAQRAAWRAVLAQARAYGAAMADGGPGPRRDELAVFVRAVVELGRQKATFPADARNAAAQGLAEAFLIVARGWAAAGGSVMSARSLAALAADLEALLEAETRAAFARSCRAAGEG